MKREARGQGTEVSKSRRWPLTSGLCPLAFLIPALAHAAIFPAQIASFTKGPPQSIAIVDEALLNELGLNASEEAVYAADGKKFTATAWRFRDSTGALAFFEAHRPPGAVSAPLNQLTAVTSDGVIQGYCNYVFQFTGTVPDAAELAQVYKQLPQTEQSTLPALITYLPKGNPTASLIPNSERYILGPVSLDRFAPGISPSVAAFHLGAEGQLGTYRTSKGRLTLLIFNYPTPGIARECLEKFQHLPGTMAKRTGPLVALVLDPPDLDAAERMLAQVRYNANITWNETVPQNPAKGVAKMLMDIFALTGVVLCLCVIGGIGFGGFRILMRKFGREDEADAMISLHLDGK